MRLEFYGRYLLGLRIPETQGETGDFGIHAIFRGRETLHHRLVVRHYVGKPAGLESKPSLGKRVGPRTSRKFPRIRTFGSVGRTMMECSAPWLYITKPFGKRRVSGVCGMMPIPPWTAKVRLQCVQYFGSCETFRIICSQARCEPVAARRKLRMSCTPV